MPTRLKALLAVLGVGCLIGFGACGDADDPGSGGSETPAVTAEQLAGHTFATDTAEGRELVEGSRVTLSFKDGSASMNAGCNNMFGPYEVKDGRLVVRGPASTMMGCEEPLMKQDQWLGGLLGGKPEISMSGDELTLADSGSGVSLTLTRE